MPHREDPSGTLSGPTPPAFPLHTSLVKEVA